MFNIGCFRIDVSITVRNREAIHCTDGHDEMHEPRSDGQLAGSAASSRADQSAQEAVDAVGDSVVAGPEPAPVVLGSGRCQA